jgi:hypothetical protein
MDENRQVHWKDQKFRSTEALSRDHDVKKIGKIDRALIQKIKQSMENVLYHFLV